MHSSARWRIWVDTGGTFTDCLALDPDGRVSRAKVLSSSALRGRLGAVAGPRAVVADVEPAAARGLLAGSRLQLLAEPGRLWNVREHRGSELVLDGPPPDAPGAAIELRAPVEAPVLAAHLVTGTPLAEALPAIDLRLATTRGTNALLERRGARVALFVTAGLADLPAIGTQQRPDLFALEVRRPAPLYEAVVEVPGRLAADGSVLVPLDLAPVRSAAGRLRDEGVGSAAVALMHSYRNPAHEKEVGRLLRGLGFGTVSLSAELAPLIKLLPRAETAVVDAYLGPVVGGYLGRVREGIGSARVHVMTSAGGLVQEASFRAKDSLLSGPAGGVVGAGEAGRRSGVARVISFDMGGTSTDVARWDGDLEYVYEHTVGDARLAAPAVAVETVAAGGGSVCTGAHGQLRVGPESAGAEPGPACYGAGGPLTLTDVNLLLGRLVPDSFGLPLDRPAARRALEEVRAQLGPAAEGAEDEQLLAGLLRIADERMAAAIRRISVRRGYDPADFALVAFGGAGPQHACAVAGLLGIGTVLVPADAGLLSAWGLGRAVVERFAARQILRPLEEVRRDLPRLLAELAGEAAGAVEAEGVPAGGIVIRRRVVRMRLEGQESPLDLEDPDDPERAFRAAYRELYGYDPPSRPVEVESLRVVASSRPRRLPVEPVPEPRGVVDRRSRHRCFVGGGWRVVATPARSDLEPGDEVPGPALVAEAHSVTVVAPGWRLTVDGAGTLRLEAGHG